MRYLITALLALSLSACSLFKDMPTAVDLQKEVARIGVQLEMAPELNRRLYMAEVYGKEQYNDNMRKINEARTQLEIIINLLDVGQTEAVGDKLKELSEAIRALTPS